MTRSLAFFTIIAIAFRSMGPAGEKAPAPGKLDLEKLPANRWVVLPTSGWRGKFWYGPGIPFGFCNAGNLGVTVYDAVLRNKTGHVRDLSTARIRKLDLAAGAWTEHASGSVKHDFLNRYKRPVVEGLQGLQLCYDRDRQTLVGITTTGLDGRGRTVEFDLKAGKHSGFKPDPSPPVVTAASLCYDPVNREVVLATGGFSPVGGTGGTWLYEGAEKTWRKLDGPKGVDAVRRPLEKLRDRLGTLRWLVWKNLEFRATGREKLLDERAKAAALSREAGTLEEALKKLGELAGKNSAEAKRPYHQGRLAAAAKFLTEATGKLSGIAAQLKAASPEELEALYRGKLLPAFEALGKAVSELAVTPEPRMSARLVYDSKNKVIVCFGGDGQDRTWGDTWVYHCDGRWWERRRPKLHPSPRSSRAMAFDPKNGVVVLVDSKRWGRGSRETWVYDAGGNEWKLLAIPAEETAFWMEYDAKTGCLVAFNHDMNKARVLKLHLAAAELVPAKAAPEAALVPIDGQYVLRDAAKVAELGKWKTEMDAWAKAVPANTWVPAPARGTGRPNWGRTWSSIVYDPGRRQIYYRDGGHGSYHGADTDHYDIPTGRWFRSDRRFGPPWPMGSYFAWGRSFSCAPWAVHTYKYCLFVNPLRKRLQRVLGQSGKMEGAKPDSVLEYDPDTGRWAREFRSLGSGAGGAFGGGVTVPGLPDAMLSISNFSRYGVKNGTAALITADGTRTMKDIGTLPRAYDDHNFCWFYDSKRKRAMYYGGGMKKGKGKPPELYALDLAAANPKWQRLELKPGREGEAGNGLPHYTREVVHVPRHDRFLMIEGLVGFGYKGPPVIWELNVADGTFRKVKLAAAGGKFPRHGGTAIGLQYDPVTDLCFYKAAGKPMYAFRWVPPEK